MSRRIVALLLAALAVVAGCGIPSDDEPRAIPDGAVDEQVGGRATSSSTSLPPTSSTDETIYLVSSPSTEDRLIAVTVPVQAGTDTSQLPRVVLERLIRTRPEEVNLAGQATNELPSDVRVIDAVVQPDGVLDLNLSSLGIEGARLRRAMAQIVFTATQLGTVNGVRVAIDGVPAAVPTQSESANPGTAVTRADYASLDPNPPVAE